MMVMVEEVYRQVFNRIVTRQYEPDTKLKEEELAEEFGINRATIRGVLNKLAQDGLVDKSPKKVTRVIDFSADDIEEIYEIRKVLEIRALRYSIPSLSIQKLKDLRARILSLAETSDYEAYKQVDADIHSYIIDSAGKERLKQMLGQMNRLIQRFRELGYRETDARNRGITEHLALLDALIIRNAEAAVQILENHIEESKKNALIQL